MMVMVVMVMTFWHDNNDNPTLWPLTYIQNKQHLKLRTGLLLSLKPCWTVRGAKSHLNDVFQWINRTILERCFAEQECQAQVFPQHCRLKHTQLSLQKGPVSSCWAELMALNQKTHWTLQRPSGTAVWYKWRRFEGAKSMTGHDYEVWTPRQSPMMQHCEYLQDNQLNKRHAESYDYEPQCSVALSHVFLN